MNNQIVTLEKSGTVTFKAQYKLIWYKRNSEIFDENDSIKSYKIQLFFENGKNVNDYVVMPKNISNVDLYINDNIEMFMRLWFERCKNMKNCMTNINMMD